MTFENKPLIMGILNFTPDSFSDGGNYFTPEKALGHAEKMQSEGADIIDVGCQSTRPGSKRITEEEELERLERVLPLLAQNIKTPLSVDTFYPECAKFAIKVGAQIINDVSGSFNARIAQEVKMSGVYYVVTHNPCGADSVSEYPAGVIGAVKDFFEECICRAKETGLDPAKLILDPGFGFGKTQEDNLVLLREFAELKTYDNLILAGVSRKRFLRSSGTGDYATSAANAAAITAGADIIRVHNVGAANEVREFLKRFKNG